MRMGHFKRRAHLVGPADFRHKESRECELSLECMKVYGSDLEQYEEGGLEQKITIVGREGLWNAQRVVYE